MRNRGIKKQIWLNREEDYILKFKSESAGLTASDFIRNLIVGYQLREKPSQEFYDAIKELRAIGKNLNQITKYANKQGFVNGINLKKEIENMNRLIVDLKKEFLTAKKKEN